MSGHPDQSHSLDELPQARMEKNWKTRLIWLVPVAAAAIAAWFIYSELFRGGPTLHIYFDNAAGIEPGKSQVKFRGTHIGDVGDVKLTKDHSKVEVSVTLDSSAESIAREGSQFWIVKPELGAEEIRGLRTIVSGDYLTVEPGGGKPQTHFEGLAEAPVVDPKGVQRIVLLAEKIGSLKERAPVFYRGIQVGEVFKTGLGKASQAIHITVDIQKHYAPLVRMNSKFWNAGGIHANISLSGLTSARNPPKRCCLAVLTSPRLTLRSTKRFPEPSSACMTNPTTPGSTGRRPLNWKTTANPRPPPTLHRNENTSPNDWYVAHPGFGGLFLQLEPHASWRSAR